MKMESDSTAFIRRTAAWSAALAVLTAFMASPSLAEGPDPRCRFENLFAKKITPLQGAVPAGLQAVIDMASLSIGQPTSVLSYSTFGNLPAIGFYIPPRYLELFAPWVIDPKAEFMRQFQAHLKQAVGSHNMQGMDVQIQFSGQAAPPEFIRKHVDVYMNITRQGNHLHEDSAPFVMSFPDRGQQQGVYLGRWTYKDLQIPSIAIQHHEISLRHHLTSLLQMGLENRSLLQGANHQGLSMIQVVSENQPISNIWFLTPPKSGRWSDELIQFHHDVLDFTFGVYQSSADKNQQRLPENLVEKARQQSLSMLDRVTRLVISDQPFLGFEGLGHTSRQVYQLNRLPSANNLLGGISIYHSDSPSQPLPHAIHRSDGFKVEQAEGERLVEISRFARSPLGPRNIGLQILLYLSFALKSSEHDLSRVLIEIEKGDQSVYEAMGFQQIAPEVSSYRGTEVLMEADADRLYRFLTRKGLPTSSDLLNAFSGVIRR